MGENTPLVGLHFRKIYCKERIHNEVNLFTIL